MSWHLLISSLIGPLSHLNCHLAIGGLTLHLFRLMIVFTVCCCDHLGAGGDHAGVFLFNFFTLQPNLIIRKLNFDQWSRRLRSKLGNTRGFVIRLDWASPQAALAATCWKHEHAFFLVAHFNTHAWVAHSPFDIRVELLNWFDLSLRFHKPS